MRLPRIRISLLAHLLPFILQIWVLPTYTDGESDVYVRPAQSFQQKLQNRRHPIYGVQPPSTTPRTYKPFIPFDPANSAGKKNFESKFIVNRPLQNSDGSENSDEPETSDSEIEENYLPQRDDSDMPKITSVDVKCSKNALNVHIKFDSSFNGLVYSKGYYSDERCRYSPMTKNGDEEGSTSLEFVIHANTCGTLRSDNGRGSAEPFIENTVIIQNTPGIQEASDSARKLRCLLDPHSVDRTVSSSLNVDTLDVISVTYSGDSIDSYMDVQHGKGPFASPVSGLVKIGETLTLVVYVLGGDNYDVRVKDCLAHDGHPENSVQLTNPQGCVMKPKLMGPWQKTTDTGSTGATIMSYAFMDAFKFPDKVEVFFECNIEICKYKCPQKEASRSGCQRRTVRTRRNASNSSDEEPPKPAESAHLMRGIRVIAPEDIQYDAPADNERKSTETSSSQNRHSQSRNDFPSVRRTSTSSKFSHDVCMSTPGFAVAVGVMLLCFVGLATITLILYVKLRQFHPDADLMSSASNQTLHRRDMLAMNHNSRTVPMPKRKSVY